MLAAKERAAGQVRAAELALDAARARRPADTHVHLPPPPEIRNEINVAPAAAPVVNVAAADVPVVNVAAPSVECRVEALMPEQPAPTIEVKVELPAEQKMQITALPPRETKTRIERNGAGEIVTSSQIEADL